MAVLDTITGARVAAGDISGPASYATGGFLLDLSATFSTLGFVDLSVETLGTLMPVHYVFTLNKDLTGANAPGKCVIKVMRDRYDAMTVGNVSGNPASTTVQASKTATGTTTGSSHDHAMNHDHPIATSGAMSAAGGAVVALAAGVQLVGHTHTVDVASFTGNTTATTHAHDRSVEYEHNHAPTVAETNAASVEVAAATNLSGVTWRYLASGF